MKNTLFGILCSAAALSIAAPALAASDYYLIIDGVDGEASAAVEVQSWSWGATNIGSSGQDGVARERPAVTASQNTQSLRESPSHASAGREAASGQASGRRSGGVAVAAGDLDGDRRADLSSLAALDEVSGFTLVMLPGTASRQMCAQGKHFTHAHLVGPQGVIDFEDLLVSSCSGGGGMSGMTVAVTGKVKGHTGHVTLLK